MDGFLINTFGLVGLLLLFGMLFWLFDEKDNK